MKEAMEHSERKVKCAEAVVSEEDSIHRQKDAALTRHLGTCKDLITLDELAATRKMAFTLIELLTAMAVLSVIVVAVANLFSHSAAAWDSGTRRAKSLLVGRALTDYYVREMVMALGDPYAPDASGFTVLKGTDAMDDKNYSMAELFGDTAALSAVGPSPDFSDPRFVAFEMTVTTDDMGRTENRVHTGRAFLWNRNRYKFD